MTARRLKDFVIKSQGVNNDSATIRANGYSELLRHAVSAGLPSPKTNGRSAIARLKLAARLDVSGDNKLPSASTGRCDKIVGLA